MNWQTEGEEKLDEENVSIDTEQLDEEQLDEENVSIDTARPVHCSSRRRRCRRSLPPLAADADATTARCWWARRQAGRQAGRWVGGWGARTCCSTTCGIATSWPAAAAACTAAAAAAALTPGIQSY